MTENHKLWGGRFEASLEKWVEEFGASISFDQKMAQYDIEIGRASCRERV